MKKLLSVFLVLIGTLVLVACGPTQRAKDPVIRGVQATVEIEVGEAYDPLKGVTAFESDDKGAKEITSELKTTFQATMTQSAGEKNFTISVTNSAGRTKTENVKLIVGSRAQVTLIAPTAVTYFVGSIEFDPLEEVRAFNSATEEEIPVEVTDEDYTTRVPGNYSYTVTARDSAGVEVSQVINLTVRPKAEIPDTIDKTKPIEIELWHSNGTTIENELKQYALDFEAKMLQEGYNVKVLITKNGDTYDVLRTNVVNALKGGSLPNIVQNYPDHVVEYNKSGAIASLTPYIKHPVWGLDETKADEKFTDILESYRAEQRATNDQGDYLSLPFNKSTEVAVYNKTLFDAVLRGRPFPETWQDLQELYPDIMRVKDNVIDQIAARWAAANKALTADDISKAKSQFVPFAYDSSANAFITLTRQFGGAYTSRDSNGKGKLEFDSPQVRAMLNYFGSKENGHWFAVPPQWEVQYANNVSMHGTTAFSVGSTGGVRYNTPVESGFELFEIGVAPVPYDKYSPESKAAIQQGTNMSLTTQGTPEERLVSWLFIKYLMSTEIQTRFAIATGYSPVRNSIYSTQAFLDYVATADEVMPKSFTEAGLSVKDYQAKYELKVKAMASKVQATQRKYLFYDTPFIGSSATRDAVGVAFDRVILNKNDSELAQAIENAIAFAVAEAMKTIGN